MTKPLLRGAADGHLCHTTQGGEVPPGMRFKVLGSPLGPMRWIEPVGSRSWFRGRPMGPEGRSPGRRPLRTTSTMTSCYLA